MEGDSLYVVEWNIGGTAWVPSQKHHLSAEGAEKERRRWQKRAQEGSRLRLRVVRFTRVEIVSVATAAKR